MSNNVLTKVSQLRNSFTKKTQVVVKPVNSFISRRPLISFSLLLLVLIGVIALSSFLRRPRVEPVAVATNPVKTEVFTVGKAPELVVQAQVEKTGVIRIVALSGGVVQNVHVQAGQRVNRGARVVSLSTNYQGGNIASLTRQLSQKSYESTIDTYQLQIDSIEGNKQLAQKGETQAAKLREIARSSQDETKRLIELNEDVVKYTEEQLTQAEVNNAPQSTITALQGQLAAQLSALSGLRTGLSTSEYLNSESNEAADLGRISRDNTLRQLELQRRAVDLGRDVALLNLKIAQVGESLMYPNTPCAGVVERVFVQVGQVVSPGTPLAVIKTDESEVSAIALVSSEVARQLSPLSASTVLVADQSYEVVPRAIASEPTDGSLHAVTFALPQELARLVSQGNSVTVRLPLGDAQTALAVPLDAVYQSQDQAYVLVLSKTDQGQRAESRVVTLREIVGSMVIIAEGLVSGDQVILNRQVMAGDPVELL